MNTTKTIPTMPLLALLGLLALPAAHAATYYVATNGVDTDSGSVTTPFRTLARGIAGAAANGDTVLVADGIYNEHALDFGAKNLVLQSQSGNPTACVLDCQLMANGIFIRGGQTPATAVSGLTIQNAVVLGTPFSGSFSSSSMYVSNSSVTLSNCIFRNNNSLGANGLLIGPAGRAILKNCSFTTSIAQARSGAMLSARGDGLTLVDCAFAGNVCTSLEILAGHSTVTGCHFTGNNGPATMRIGGNSAATITACSFIGNDATSGGGLHMNGGAVSLANCVFTGNDGHNFGGGIGQDGGSLVAQNCIFLGNRVQTKGGAIAVSNARLALKNCLLARNTSDFGWGCALLLDTLSGANVSVTDCTIAENFSGGRTSAEVMLFNQGGTLTVANSILWNNVTLPSGVQFAANNGGVTTVTYSDVLGGYAGTGNINANPLFVDVSTNNYRLQAASPCINTASAAAPDLPAIDLDGAPRIMGSAPDMGAYELWLPSWGAWCVDRALGNDANPGSAASPFQTVNKAINVAANGQSIYIKQGNYGSDQPRITKSLRLLNWGEAGLARIGQP